jgi:hypothetical protein
VQEASLVRCQIGKVLHCVSVINFRFEFHHYGRCMWPKTDLSFLVILRTAWSPLPTVIAHRSTICWLPWYICGVPFKLSCLRYDRAITLNSRWPLAEIRPQQSCMHWSRLLVLLALTYSLYLKRIALAPFSKSHSNRIRLPDGARWLASFHRKSGLFHQLLSGNACDTFQHVACSTQPDESYMRNCGLRSN